jgi:hypothetical protein
MSILLELIRVKPVLNAEMAFHLAVLQLGCSLIAIPDPALHCIWPFHPHLALFILHLALHSASGSSFCI